MTSITTSARTLSSDVQRARTQLRSIVGSEIQVVPHESGKHLVARVGLDMHQLCGAVSGTECPFGQMGYTVFRTHR